MILFINRLLHRFGGSYLSNNDLVHDLSNFFDINHLLFVDNRWKKDRLGNVPKIKKTNCIFQSLWRSDLVPEEKILLDAAQIICEHIQTAEKETLVILGHESLIWLMPILKKSMDDIRVCVIHHGTPTHCLRELDFSFNNKFFDNLNYTDFLVTVSPHLSQILIENYPKKIITIPNLPHLPIKSCNKYRIKNQRTNILQISTIRSLKRPFDGLELIEQLTARNLLAHLTFVGTGELLNDFIEQINIRGLQNQVKLISFATREKIASLLHSHDFLFLPSVKEGFPRVVIEAMLSGTPPIISTGANGSNLVEDYINGLIFPTGDLKSAALKIQETIQNYKKYSSIIQGGYKTLEKIKIWRREALHEFVKTIDLCFDYSKGMQYGRIPIS